MAKLHFLHSVMNAGKSTHLLQVRHNYIENMGNVLVLTSAIDDRMAVGMVSSRIGLSAEAIAVDAACDLLEIVTAHHREAPLSAVLIDEVQFMTAAHIRQAARVVDELGVPVMAYGLKNNVFGTLFSEAIVEILALADEIKELKTVCHCGSKATMILRYAPDGSIERSGDVVEIGGESRYVSVCRRHWKAGDIGEAARRRLPGIARQEALA